MLHVHELVQQDESEPTLLVGVQQVQRSQSASPDVRHLATRDAREKRPVAIAVEHGLEACVRSPWRSWMPTKSREATMEAAALIWLMK